MINIRYPADERISRQPWNDNKERGRDGLLMAASPAAVDLPTLNFGPI